MSQLLEKTLQKVHLQSITAAKRGTEAPLHFSLLNVVDTKVFLLRNCIAIEI